MFIFLSNLTNQPAGSKDTQTHLHTNTQAHMQKTRPNIPYFPNKIVVISIPKPRRFKDLILYGVNKAVRERQQNVQGQPPLNTRLREVTPHQSGVLHPGLGPPTKDGCGPAGVSPDDHRAGSFQTSPMKTGWLIWDCSAWKKEGFRETLQLSSIWRGLTRELHGTFHPGMEW